MHVSTGTLQVHLWSGIPPDTPHRFAAGTKNKNSRIVWKIKNSLKSYNKQTLESTIFRSDERDLFVAHFEWVQLFLEFQFCYKKEVKQTLHFFLDGCIWVEVFSGHLHWRITRTACQSHPTEAHDGSSEGPRRRAVVKCVKLQMGNAGHNICDTTQEMWEKSKTTYSKKTQFLAGTLEHHLQFRKRRRVEVLSCDGCVGYVGRYSTAKSIISDVFNVLMWSA